jgi:radical SAM protein
MSVEPHRAVRPPLRAPRHDVNERPFIVIWECTRACPLACVHCRAEAQLRRQPGELSTAEAADLAAQVAGFGHPAPLFVITGGDPFARDDLVEIVRAAVRQGLAVAVSPSGTPSLTAENLAALKDAGATAISLSLDGSTAERHDGFRGVSGVFEHTIRAWTAARELGLRVQINSTVSQHNLTDLPAIVRMVATLGAMTWSAFLLVPTGRGRNLDALDAQTVEDMLNFVYDAGEFIPARTTEAHHFRRVSLQRAILARRGLDHVDVMGLGPLYRRLTDDLKRLMADVRLRPRRTPMDVNAGRGFVFVSHLGDVHPSGFLPVAAGNVREQPLPEIYRESALFSDLRDVAKLGGRCGRCEFATVCGGSRSRAFALAGDPLAEEPWCGYEPGSFPFQDDVAELLGATRPNAWPTAAGRVVE